MRTFISLELPSEVKQEIALAQQELRFCLPQVHLVNPQTIHLTLAFLGSISPNKIQIIKKILEKIVSAPIKLKLHRLGSFPNPKKPRIIYLDLKGDLDELDRLVKNLRYQLKKKCVYFDDKPFSAHITLARIKKRQNLTTVITKIQIPPKEFLAEEVNFTKSILTPAGPIYETIKEVFLNKPTYQTCELNPN